MDKCIIKGLGVSLKASVSILFHLNIVLVFTKVLNVCPVHRLFKRLRYQLLLDWSLNKSGSRLRNLSNDCRRYRARHILTWLGDDLC